MIKSTSRTSLTTRGRMDSRQWQQAATVGAVLLVILFLTLGAYDPRGNSFAASVQLVAARRLTQNGGPLLLEGSFEEELVEPDPLRLPTTTLTTHGTQNDPQQQLQEQQQQQPLDLSSLPLPGDTARVYEGVCKQVRSGLVPALRTLKVFRSGKHRPPTAVTVVTQLSIDRLAALELQCSVWGSSIAAAVHVPLLEGLVSSSLEEIDGQGAAAPLGLLQAFHDRMESEGGCTLDMVYVTEEVPSADFVGLYPVNALRNRALQLALTDVVLLLDADFIPNRQLSEDLTEEEMYKTLVRVTSVQQAIVLPAFEVLLEGEEGKNAALRAAESKDNIRRMIGNHRIQGFHIDGFVNGHRATDFERWQTASVAYRVEYEEGFEPYVIVHRKYVPWYDERFKGYRKNKVVHLMHMHALGVSFVTTPRGYVIHVPHKEADTWRVTQATGTWKKLQRMYEAVKTEVAEDAFVPSTAFKCKAREPLKWSWYRRRRR